MKKRWLAILSAILMMMPAGCAAGAGTDVWMYAVSVGKADAILLGVDDAVCLVDTGYGRSRGKILAAMEYMGVEKLDAVFLTHTDDDHTGGLDWLAESHIQVDAWYGSAMYIDVKEENHPLVRAAGKRGQPVIWLKAGDRVPMGTAVLDVLAPQTLNQEKDDNNSLVMMLRSAEGNILLGGDMEFPEEEGLLRNGVALKCDVLKVANHADDDTTSEAFAVAASPKLAVICTDTREKAETPDPRVVAQLQSVGAQVRVTQECTGGLLVRLKGGQPSVETVNLPEATQEIVMEQVRPEEDTVTLYNRGTQAVDLGNWVLFSSKGKEALILAEDTVIQPGGRLVIGSKSASGNCDVIWPEKNVVHDSKTDVLTLYDLKGMPAASADNGY